MNIDNTLHTLYSIYLHKTIISYDAIKYNYKVSNKMEKKLQQFLNQNKFVISSYNNYSDNNLRIRGLINFFVNNHDSLVNVSDEEYNDFIYSIKNYKDILNDFLTKTKLEDFNKHYIHGMYLRKEISFYVYWYSFEFLNLKPNIMMIETLKKTYKLMICFKHFDKEYISKLMLNKKKELELNSNSM